VERGRRASQTLLTPPIAFTVVVASNPEVRLPNLERAFDHNNIFQLISLQLSYTLVKDTKSDTRHHSSISFLSSLKSTSLAPSRLSRFDASESSGRNNNMSATTPYRTNMTAHHTAHQTPSRRALGDLTPRAINSPIIESPEAIRPRSPLKKVTSHIPSVFADKENLENPGALPQGKKRGIDEVDDAEKAGSGKMLAHARDASMWESGMQLTAAAVQRHTVCCSEYARHVAVILTDSGKQPRRSSRSRITNRAQHAHTGA
jgi:hypothetical protein